MTAQMLQRQVWQIHQRHERNEVQDMEKQEVERQVELNFKSKDEQEEECVNYQNKS